MKVLVWIGCFLGVEVLNVFLGELIGFRLGYLPVMLIVSGISGAICKGMGDEEKPAEKSPVKAVPSARPDWVCASCGTENKGTVGSCQSCGVTRAWSEKKSGAARKQPDMPPAGGELPETVTVSSDFNAIGNLPVDRQQENGDTETAPKNRVPADGTDAGKGPAVIITPVVPERKPEPVEETTRWICPGCGLVHSRQMASCFHCGTQQSKATKFV